MNKKITSSALAALMIAGSTSFSALAAMANGTVVIGTKAFDMAYANDVKNAEEIGNAIVAGGNQVYIKDFEGNWIDNATTKKVDASVIPAVTYKSATGVVTEFAAKDVDATGSAIIANTAKSFEVKFGNAVTDTSKVKFSVKRGTFDTTLTTTWNTEKTIATLTNSSKLAEGEYTIVVTVADVEVNKATIKIEQEKVAKITFLSDTIVRANNAQGYASYKVENQYGEDITNAPLATNLDWKSSINSGNDGMSPVAKTNRLLFQRGIVNQPSLADLSALKQIVVTAYDNNSNFFVSKTLNVSETIGGISQIAFKEVVDKDGKAAELVAGSPSKYYLSYEAKDAFGNVVDDYATLNNTNIINFYTSNGSVAGLRVIQDPKNSNKALLEVTPGTAANVVMDMPVRFTAIAPGAGKSGALDITVKKAAAVNSFSIQAPSTEVAVGETVEIPFVAYDQNGKQMTSIDQLLGKITVTASGAAATTTYERAADGSMKIMVKFDAASKYLLTGSINNTGKISNTSVNVKVAAYPSNIAFDETAIRPAMVKNAVQKIDLGYLYSGINIKDQYDRVMSLVRSNTIGADIYTVSASSNNSGAVAVSGFASLTSPIVLTGGSTEGTATITLTLLKNGATTNQTTAFNVTNVKKTDVVGYGIDDLDPMFATGSSGYFNNGASADYTQDIAAFGKLLGGTEVELDSADIVSYSANDARFNVTTTGGTISVVNLGSGVAEATTKIYATIMNGSGAINAETEVKASTATPVAKSIAVNIPALVGGVPNTVVKVGDTVQLPVALATALEGKSIFKYDKDGVSTSAYRSAEMYVRVKDSYAGYGLKPSFATIVGVNGNTNSADVNANTGVVAWKALPQVGQEYVLTSTCNGMTVTQKIIIK